MVRHVFNVPGRAKVMAASLRHAMSDNLAFRALRMPMMVAITIVWAEGQLRCAAQTSSGSAAARSAAAERDGCFCQSKKENEYYACKRSHPCFLLFGRPAGESSALQLVVLLKEASILLKFLTCEFHCDIPMGCWYRSAHIFVDRRDGDAMPNKSTEPRLAPA
jgi:hypothetical protein